jgi:hypothetical protein
VITGATTVAAVIGSPVKHSLSPALHNAAFAAAGVDWVYTAFEVAPGEAVRALDAMRALGLGGLSVTMPHKEAVADGVDALDPADASQASPNIAGLTNLDEYRRRFGLNGEKPQFYSREVSLFNFGAPTARFEAISREQSVFNFGSPPFRIEAVGRELSIFNGERPPTAGYPEAYSREVSVYNFGAPPFRIEAIGREVSVFNGQRPAIAGYPEAYSREVSLFNFGAPTARVEAISREVSVFNDIP